MKALATAGAVLSSLLAASLAAAPSIPAYITAAVADSARPAEDKQQDVDRQPAATLAFAGVKPGVTVIEIAEVLGTSRQAPHQQVSLSNRGCHCNETQHVCQRPLKSCAGPTAIAAPTGAWSP